MYFIKNLMLLLVVLSSFACQSKQDDEEAPTSSKKKMAYAPSQKAVFEHVSPSQVNVPLAQPIQETKPSTEVQMPQANPHAQANQQAQEKPHAQANPHAQGLIPTQHNPHAQANPHAQGLIPTQNNPHAQANPHAQPTTQPTQPTTQPTGQLPSGHPPITETTTTTTGNITGTITLKAELASEIKPGSVLFVSVRRYAESGQGMLLAAIKEEGIVASKFPFSYTITEKNAMMGAPLGGEIRVTARIDQDGDAISKTAGDLIGNTTQKVNVGENPVNFEIDQKFSQ